MLWRSASSADGGGFTLFELLLVIVFMGVLTAIALPNYLSQASKARQAEAKQMLGAMNRGQQAYRFENSVFASSIQNLNLAVTVGTANPNAYETPYFVYSVASGAMGDEAYHLAVPQPTYRNDTKKATSAIARTSDGRDVAALCEADRIGTDPVLTFAFSVPSCSGGKLVY
jgi:type II secretion system protein G